MFSACYHDNLGSCSGRSRSKQTATVKLSGRCLFLFHWFLDQETGALLSRGIITAFLEEDGKLPTSHDRSPPGYFPCLLSMLAPFVALGKSLKFSGARSSSGVKRHKCMRASAMPSYYSREPGRRPFLKWGY